LARLQKTAASRANVVPLTSLTPSPDFEKAMESCGGVGERVEDPEKLIPTLERALRHVADGKQVLLNVITEGARVGGG
jgi:acetolactate synthase-1/2/3 large subunit